MTKMIEPPIRLLLVDAHERSRCSSRALSDTYPNLEVVGETGDRDGVLALVGICAPDLFVIGMRVEGSSGDRVTRELLALRPNVRVVLLTLFDSPEYRAAAFAAGAAGCVQKEARTVELVDAVLAAMKAFMSISAAPDHLTKRELKNERNPWTYLFSKAHTSHACRRSPDSPSRRDVAADGARRQV